MTAPIQSCYNSPLGLQEGVTEAEPGVYDALDFIVIGHQRGLQKLTTR